MLLTPLLAMLVALIPPPGAAAPLPASPSPTASATSPGPSASPRVLKTIVTVISSPYCNALAQHFNAAFVPMLANDRVFTQFGTQLEDMNVMFNYPDYVNRFLDLRVKIVKESNVLIGSLKPIQAQIDALRQSASLSNDPAAAKQMRDAASQLQDAYKHQFQLSTDLTSLAQNLMEYDIERGKHPLGGFTLGQQAMPADEKNLKVYLHYDKQIASISDAEDHAVDVAYAIAQDRCTKP